ncbi:MAG: sensor histidine kinase [Mycobacteriaceae bacterium]
MPTSGAGPSLDSQRDLVHDLWQPLSGILALTDCPAADSSAADLAHRLDQVHALAEWMRQLLPSPSLPGTTPAASGAAPADVGAVCASVAGAGAAASAVRVRCVSDGPATVPVDVVVLRRIITNVVDNAIRAAEPDGRVDMAVTATEQRVTVDVTDDGPGWGRVKRHTGRGLNITRRLLATCEGSVDISTGPAGGVRVRLDFPRPVDHHVRHLGASA